jgi:formylglycine-generating enzyme required for sulfatase activity
MLNQSLGMKMMEIPEGEFLRGMEFKESWQDYHDRVLRSDSGLLPTSGELQSGDLFCGGVDESPVHRVILSKPFLMSTTEVTNAQYEQFDPGHARANWALEDDAAVSCVSWNDAVAFCEWLSEREGCNYRLPTEAEWEYACRAGSTTNFHTGDNLPEEFLQRSSRRVGLTTPNAWGLYDMHGNVEEWCFDGYGDYPAGEVNDPIGCPSSLTKVVRGGCDEDSPVFMRSGSRSSTVADFCHERIGFRVVCADSPVGKILSSDPRTWQKEVCQDLHDWSNGPPVNQPYFGEILSFAEPPPMELRPGLPFYATNHCPAVAWCPNGDVFTIWWSAARDGCRSTAILCARLRAGADTYDPPSRFFVAAGRELCSSSFWNNGKGRLIWLNNIAPAGDWSTAPVMASFSEDNGLTWTQPKMVLPDVGPGQPSHMVMFRGSSGGIYQPADYWETDEEKTENCGATALYRSLDEGESWEEVTRIAHQIENLGREGKTAGAIAGPHGVAVELKDGSLLGIGRRAEIEGNLIFSRSRDGGANWTYSRSPFPKIRFGQRPSLLRLKEGGILFISYTGELTRPGHSKIAPVLSEAGEMPIAESLKGWSFLDAENCEFTGYGLYAAVSYDEGETWPVRKLITPGGPRRRMFGGGHHHFFWMDETHAEPGGYTYTLQAPDGVIHLVNSCLHYRFNLKWLETPPVLERRFDEVESGGPGNE